MLLKQLINTGNIRDRESNHIELHMQMQIRNGHAGTRRLAALS